MTALIAILNRDAVALAADSAVTSTSDLGDKIFTSSNKLFALSKYHPIGIMIYGNASFMGIPWETIIKMYSEQLGKTAFKRLNQYANHFIKFLNSYDHIVKESIQKEAFSENLHIYLEMIKDVIKKQVDIKYEKTGRISNWDLQRITAKVIDQHYQLWREAPYAHGIPDTFTKSILSLYGDIIKKAIDSIFAPLSVSQRSIDKLRRIASYIEIKFPAEMEDTDITGIIVAGFGEDEIFPCLKAFEVKNIINNRVIYNDLVSVKIGYDKLGAVMPFAQREMVSTFMEGIDPKFFNTIKDCLIEVFSEYPNKIIKSLALTKSVINNKYRQKIEKDAKSLYGGFISLLNEYSYKVHISQVTRVVAILPKNELAEMAESLVNLTCFKRRVTMDSETVAGPIDVATISKGDGFIWIKRKQYFEEDLNRHFIINQCKEYYNE